MPRNIVGTGSDSTRDDTVSGRIPRLRLKAYQLGLGWLFGRPLILLNHIGVSRAGRAGQSSKSPITLTLWHRGGGPAPPGIATFSRSRMWIFRLAGKPSR